jgi:hypothetical protein
MPPGPIAGRSAWYGRDLTRSDEWIRRVSAAELDELDAALRHTQRAGLDIIGITRREFPLPTLGPALDAIRGELLRGRGFVLIRGLPMERYGTAEAATLYWGIGSYLGTPRSQNARGHLLGHVRDMGLATADPNVRTYQTTERQRYHTDSTDIVSLLCLRKARRGGLSSIGSSVTVYNEMRRRHPDLVGELFEPLHTDRRGEVPEGERPWFAIPLFNWHDGLLSTIYSRRYIESAGRFPDVPALTDRQVAALDAFDALIEDPEIRLDMAFEPGDMQFLHNHQILHDRTAYEDWPEPERKRHLLRLWLCAPDGRPLPECYLQRYGRITVGDRGGIVVRGANPTVPLEPC